MYDQTPVAYPEECTTAASVQVIWRFFEEPDMCSYGPLPVISYL